MEPAEVPLSREELALRDRHDPLATFRSRFHLPEKTLYFDGNSLGPLPRNVQQHLAEVVGGQWGEDLIQSWNRHGWIHWPRRVGRKIARLVEAGEDDVVVADSTSINLYKLLANALALRPDRSVILTDDGQFPTDVYMAQGLCEGRPEARVKVVPRADLVGALDENVAVVLLGQVDFKTGELLPMVDINRAVRAVGALSLWDLAHSAGALPVDLEGSRTDLAVGCGYKFLNGGPGAPSFLYVAPELQEASRSPLSGWLGHRDPFAFDLRYQPAEGIDRFQCGSPPILSLAALDAGLEAFEGVDLHQVRRKSQDLGDLFLRLVDERCVGLGLGMVSPRDRERRGSQISLRHPQGFAVMQALIERGVVGDFRTPDVLRFGLTPLYQRYTDVWDAVENLREVLEGREWDRPRFQRRGKVT